jgi:hypothetical protein
LEIQNEVEALTKKVVVSIWLLLLAIGITLTNINERLDFTSPLSVRLIPARLRKAESNEFNFKFNIYIDHCIFRVSALRRNVVIILKLRSLFSLLIVHID